MVQKNIYSGKFMVIEGLDGSGQSTQARLLKDFLIKKGHQVILTKEPTRDSMAGKEIRKILDKKQKASPQQLQELFAEDRREHLESLIVPSLKKGKIVISDRYFFSSFAYGQSEGLDLDWLIGINSKFLTPDFTFLLKVSPKTCLQRIEKRGEGKTLFEKEGKLGEVWRGYQILPTIFRNIKIIDGEKLPEEVFSQIKKVVDLKLRKI